MKKFLAIMVVVMLVGASISVAGSVTVTNRGVIFTVDTLEGDAADGTAVEDQSVEATPTDRRGLVVAHYAVPAAGVSNATIVLGDFTVPKGAILGDAIVDVVSAIGPSTVSNDLVVGSARLVPHGAQLTTGGTRALAITSPTLLTTGGKVTLYLTNAAAAGAPVLCTGGVFTVYVPYILGNQR